SFEFRLHSVGPAVLAGPILWDATDAGEVLRFYRDFVRDAPDELGTVVRFGTAPPLAVIPEDLHWRPVVMVGTCYAGPMEDGEQVLRPLAHPGLPSSTSSGLRRTWDSRARSTRPSSTVGTTTGSPPTSPSSATTSST